MEAVGFFCCSGNDCPSVSATSKSTPQIATTEETSPAILSISLNSDPITAPPSTFIITIPPTTNPTQPTQATKPLETRPPLITIIPTPQASPTPIVITPVSSAPFTYTPPKLPQATTISHSPIPPWDRNGLRGIALAGYCATPAFSGIIDARGTVTVCPIVGCNGDKLDCCPMDTSNGTATATGTGTGAGRGTNGTATVTVTGKNGTATVTVTRPNGIGPGPGTGLGTGPGTGPGSGPNGTRTRTITATNGTVTTTATATITESVTPPTQTIIQPAPPPPQPPIVQQFYLPGGSDPPELPACPGDYITISNVCCPSGYQLWDTLLGGQTPCYSTLSTFATPPPPRSGDIPTVTLSGEPVTSTVVNVVYAMHYPVRGKSGLKTGAKVGIGVGVGVAGLAAASLLAWWAWRRRKGREQEGWRSYGEASESPVPGP